MNLNENKRLLDSAEELCLTKETVENLLKTVVEELISNERYEEINPVKDKANKYLNKLRQTNKCSSVITLPKQTYTNETNS